MDTKQIDSIIFDLDGTLWDSADSIIDSWNKTLAYYPEIRNELTADDLKGVMGLVIKDIAKTFFPYIEETRRLEIVEKCCKNECVHLAEHGALLYEKLEEVLNILSAKYKLFIVSNCQCGYIEAFFKAHNLSRYFLDYENSGRTGLTKGENIKLIMKRNSLNNPVYVGDTEGDMKAAKLAGIPFIYAKYGFGKVDEYDFAIDSIDELPGKLCLK